MAKQTDSLVQRTPNRSKDGSGGGGGGGMNNNTDRSNSQKQGGQSSNNNEEGGTSSSMIPDVPGISRETNPPSSTSTSSTNHQKLQTQQQQLQQERAAAAAGGSGLDRIETAIVEDQRQQQQQQQQFDDYSSSSSKHRRNKRTAPSGLARGVGAAVGAALIGLLLSGHPVIAVLFALLSIYLAKKNRGPAGDIARAVGDVALSAADKAEEVNEKHKMVERAKIVTCTAWNNAKLNAGKAWTAAKEMDRSRYQILQKAEDSVVVSGQFVTAALDRLRVRERGSQALSWVSNTTTEYVAIPAGTNNNNEIDESSSNRPMNEESGV